MTQIYTENIPAGEMTLNFNDSTKMPFPSAILNYKDLLIIIGPIYFIIYSIENSAFNRKLKAITSLEVTTIALPHSSMHVGYNISRSMYFVYLFTTFIFVFVMLFGHSNLTVHSILTQKH